MSNATNVKRIKKVLEGKTMTSEQILKCLMEKYARPPTMHELANCLRRSEFEKIDSVEVKYRDGNTSQVALWRLSNENTPHH